MTAHVFYPFFPTGKCVTFVDTYFLKRFIDKNGFVHDDSFRDGLMLQILDFRLMQKLTPQSGENKLLYVAQSLGWSVKNLRLQTSFSGEGCETLSGLKWPNCPTAENNFPPKWTNVSKKNKSFQVINPLIPDWLTTVSLEIETFGRQRMINWRIFTFCIPGTKGFTLQYWKPPSYRNFHG